MSTLKKEGRHGDDHDCSAEDKGYVTVPNLLLENVRVEQAPPKALSGKMGRPIGDCSRQRLERRRRISRVWQNGSNCWTEMGIHWNMKRFARDL